MLPFIIAGAIGFGIYKAFSDDDDDYPSHSNHSSADNEYKENKKVKVLDDIDSYKKQQVSFFKKKYHVDIKINDTKLQKDIDNVEYNGKI